MRHSKSWSSSLWTLLALAGCGELTQPRPLEKDMQAPVWFQLDDAAPDSDELTGYVLRAGRVGEAPSLSMTLPPEAFVAGPHEHDLIVGQNDGTRSTLELVDALSGERRVLVQSDQVLRRAARSGDDVYVLVLDQASREERGVYRFSASADHAQQLEDGELVLPGLPPDAAMIFGPTFNTILRPTPDGLIVQSCGELLCRARVLDFATGDVVLRDEIGQGELIGVTGRTLVTWEAGNAWPAKVLAIDVDSGAATELAFAYGAVLARAEHGADVIVFESGDVPGEVFEQTFSDDAPRLLAVFTDDVLHPVPQTDLSFSGLVLPDGFVAIGGDGRVALPGAPPDPLLLRLADGALFQTVFE
jgi:hypothetical protein